MGSLAPAPAIMMSRSITVILETQTLPLSPIGVPNTWGAAPICSTYTDADGDQVPDLWDTDDDNDLILDVADNCSLVSNVDQVNTDGDTQGDACDADDDNDLVSDSSDNCSLVSNADQANADGDTQGNACDVDDDNDLVLDGSDNCSLVSNADQANADGDTEGNACDADDDNDLVFDGSDNCSLVSNADQANADGDTEGNACDADDYNDLVSDGSDNCSLVPNADQANADGDANGNACDADDDNDLVLDGSDNCSLVSNADQANADDDAEGDACDADDDNDGISDVVEIRTPSFWNSDWKACKPIVSLPSQNFSSIIPVTGCQGTILSCSGLSTSLEAAGFKVAFDSLCGYSAVLTEVPEDSLLHALPDGKKFVGGMDVVLLQDNTSVNTLPAGAKATLSFDDPVRYDW